MATIEIDGKTLEAENGKMIIEVADEAGIYIPRFCYHKKLSIAANCRMCLVEVENNRKTIPACSTPISNGMKVFTKSSAVIHSQQAVMEFLLINHPLDCPICDQGGECELQDLSMGFGFDQSEYKETKRAVEDDNLGPLIATEMTRCIHCTRCVRFGDEIAGFRELGATGRGEDMQIGTYIKHSMRSEVSGNIIDLCPVGALTSKPYRFTARPWELMQHEGIAPHDCLGSNVYIHVRRNELMRVVPKDCEAINETWLSDRDRFSYTGLNNEARCKQPMIKRNGQWEVVDWVEALQYTVEGTRRILQQYGAEQMAAFASSSSTLEELFLLQKLMRSLGVRHLDHRLQQTDFRDQSLQGTMPSNSLLYAEIEHQKMILLLGCNIDREVPLAGLRVRKAFRNGAKIYTINPVDYTHHFEVAGKIIVSPAEMTLQLACVLLALIEDITQVSPELHSLLIGLEGSPVVQEIAAGLQQPDAVILMGAICENHPDASLLRTLVFEIERISHTRVVKFTIGSNSAGAWLAGMLPHREALGKSIESPGLDVRAALEAKLKAYFLMAVEPGFDFANPYETRQSMLAAEFVVLLTAYQDESMYDYADVILPMAPFAETSGTYINVDKAWQTVKGALAPQGEARPAWKILRVLGNLLDCNGFEYASTDDVLQEIKREIDMIRETKYTPFYPETLPQEQANLVRVGEWPLYRCDQIVRHAQPLQVCASADTACIRIHPETAHRLKLDGAATISQGDIKITLPLERDERLAQDVLWVANALPETVDLGSAFGPITVLRPDIQKNR